MGTSVPKWTIEMTSVVNPVVMEIASGYATLEWPRHEAKIASSVITVTPNNTTNNN